MAIQLRRGDYEDFDKAKMQEGELAVVTTNDPNTESGCATYVSYASGDENKVKRLVHEDDYNNDFENLSADLEQEVQDLYSGLNLDEAIIRKAFDDLNINGENLYNEIQELKPKVIGEEGEWKRATIVIPELEYKYKDAYDNSPAGLKATIDINDYITDDIEDAIVTSVQAPVRTYPEYIKTPIDPECYYCNLHPYANKWTVIIRDTNADNTTDTTAFTVIDLLYKPKET